ncbi:hypothetical protein BGZ70_007166, partial [Mortierella alpina]
GGNVRMEDQLSIRIGIPSINTLTFVYTEHTLLNDTRQMHFTLQKQNLRTIGGFGNRKVIGRVILSPDTFYVTRYIDKPSYTWVDLAGALGGMASLALAVWIFLFGSGRYKSWGIMQRYILQTSPNSRRYREKQPEPQGVWAKFKRFFQRQLTRLDSSAESELDHVPLQSPTFQDRHQRASLRYSTALNANQPKLAAGPVGTRGKGSQAEGNMDNSARYSMESSGNNNFYFSDQGTPGTRSLQPLAPINENSTDDAELQVEELIRLIDLRIDERMWSLERTLSRYYLDGFRLRNYSAHPNARTFYFNEGMSSNDPSAMERGSPMEFLPGDETPPSTTPPMPMSPSTPLYPPRPPVSQPRYTVVEGSRASNLPVPAPVLAPAAAALSSAGTKEEILETSVMSPPEFPRRGDMRGTIRSAVERLQHEWPQSQAYEAYVPRTQYQGRSDQNNSSNRGHGNAPTMGDESPPRY